VAESTVPKQYAGRRFMRWLLQERIEEVQGPEAREGEEQLAWWQVVCLAGVDYFSPLATYQGLRPPPPQGHRGGVRQEGEETAQGQHLTWRADCDPRGRG
jgi:hypothetical protein